MTITLPQISDAHFEPGHALIGQALLQISRCTTLANLPRDICTVQAGTSLSSRRREGIANSVNLLRCDGARAPRRCTVERCDYVTVCGRLERHASQGLTFEASDAA